ncbi:MAG: carbohydrate ABC transporter permease [Acidimicrobiia bacterium]|jgi:multiple sugar transport system permease protein
MKIRQWNTTGPVQPRRVVLHYVVATILAAFFIMPVLFMFVGSLKPNEQVLADMSSWRAFIPTSATLQNYVNAADRAEVWRLLFNSIVIVVSVLVLGAFVNSLFGYALARFRFTGRRFLLILVIALLIVPFQSLAVPLLLMFAKAGWLDTYRVQIAPQVVSPFFIFLFYTYFLRMPRELEEAASVDGAGPVRIFFRIMAPLAKPVYGAMAILGFLFNWGELLWPVMVTRGVDVRPLSLGIATFQTLPPIQWGEIMAFASIMTVPMLVVFVAFQRTFVEGVATQGMTR